jgi:HlyD family secretion protein
MARTVRIRRWMAAAALLLAAAGAGAAMLAGRSSGESTRGRRYASSTVTRRDFVRSLRLAGTVEAVHATTLFAPRLAGQNTNSLVITRLAKAGSIVKQGDLVVEFDRQEQLKNALDRRAELNDLEQQIRKKDAEARAARARDDSELKQAESALGRAELEMVKNEMLPRIQVEKNRQTLEEASAKLKQLTATYELKRRAAAADLRILEIRRDRAGNAMRQAETNAEKMSIRAPLDGLIVIRTVWKTNTPTEVQEGEEVRSGMPIVDVVDPAAMRVRAKVSQADINELTVGQSVRIGLDAYPDLSFGGRVAQISPIGVLSSLSPKVRTFVVLINVEGSHPNLTPDLTASLDIELSRVHAALVVPRDALRYEEDRVLVRVQRGAEERDQPVTVGPLNAHEAVVASGLEEGATVLRNINMAVER